MKNIRRFILGAAVLGVLLGVLPASLLVDIGIPSVVAAPLLVSSSSKSSCCSSVEGFQPPPSFFKERRCESCHFFPHPRLA